MRIGNAQNSGMWAPRQMFLDRFGLHGRHRDRLKRWWWRSMQSKQGGIMECRKHWRECVNVLPATLCILAESFSYRYIMGEWWPVACKYRLINRCIAGAAKLLARYIDCSRVRANSARMLLRLAFPHGQVSICQKDYEYVQIMMKTIIDGCRCSMDDTSKWASTVCQWFVVL